MARTSVLTSISGQGFSTRYAITVQHDTSLDATTSYESFYFRAFESDHGSESLNTEHWWRLKVSYRVNLNGTAFPVGFRARDLK